MAAKLISQREARRLRRRVQKLETLEACRRNRWAAEYPCGTWIGGLNLASCPELFSAVVTARLLKHAVVVTPDSDSKKVAFRALPLAEQRED